MTFDDRQARGPVAWVIEPGAFDYSPAKVFVEGIRQLTAPQLSPNADMAWHEAAIQGMRAALSDYRPGHDFVIPTGRPVRMMLAAMVMREISERHKLLGWDDKQQRYMVYDLFLGQAPQLFEPALPTRRKGR